MIKLATKLLFLGTHIAEVINLFEISNNIPAKLQITQTFVCLRVQSHLRKNVKYLIHIWNLKNVILHVQSAASHPQQFFANNPRAIRHKAHSLFICNFLLYNIFSLDMHLFATELQDNTVYPKLQQSIDKNL